MNHDLEAYLKSSKPHSKKKWDSKKRGRFHAEVIDVEPSISFWRKNVFVIPTCILLAFLSVSMLLGCTVDTLSSGTYYFQSFANGLAATAYTVAGCLLSGSA